MSDYCFRHQSTLDYQITVLQAGLPYCLADIRKVFIFAFLHSKYQFGF